MSNTDYLNPRFPAAAKNKTKHRLILVLFLIFLIIAFRLPLGAFSYNLFVLGDHLLKFSEAIPPFIVWGIAGLFIGAIVGSFVVSKKYKLPLKWNLPAIGGLVLFSIVIYFNYGLLTDNNGRRLHLGGDGSKFADISASQSIPDYDGHHYGPENLLKTDASAWMYIEKEGQPESISFVFNAAKMTGVSNIQLTGIRLNPGYAKNYDIWKNSNKPKDYIVYKNSEELVKGQLDERFGDQKIKTDKVKIQAGDTIRIAITSTYKPLKKKVNIIAITELYPVTNYVEPKN